MQSTPGLFRLLDGFLIVHALDIFRADLCLAY